jgi:hypothetical protein
VLLEGIIHSTFYEATLSEHMKKKNLRKEASFFRLWQIMHGSAGKYVAGRVGNTMARESEAEHSGPGPGSRVAEKRRGPALAGPLLRSAILFGQEPLSAYQRETVSLSRYTVAEPEPRPSIWKLVTIDEPHPSERALKAVLLIACVVPSRVTDL